MAYTLKYLRRKLRRIRCKMWFLNFLHFTRQNPRNRMHLYLRLKDLLRCAIEAEHIGAIENALGLRDNYLELPALTERIRNIDNKIKGENDPKVVEEQNKEIKAVKKALNTKSLFESYSKKIDDAQDDFDEMYGIVKALNLYLKACLKENTLEITSKIGRLVDSQADKYHVSWQK